MSLRTKLIVAALFLAIFPPATVLLVNYVQVRASFIDTTTASLFQISEFQQAIIESRLDRYAANSQHVAEYPAILAATRSVLQGVNIEAQVVTELMQYHTHDLQGALAFEVVDDSGQVFFSSFENGTGHQREGFSLLVQKYRSILCPASGAKPVPVFLADARVNGYIETVMPMHMAGDDSTATCAGAFLVGRYGLEEISHWMLTENVSLRPAVDRDLLLKMPSRFTLLDQSGKIVLDPLNLSASGKLLSRPQEIPFVNACIEQNRESSGIWEDEGGAKVIGIAHCLKRPGLDWVLLAETPVNLAYKSVRDLGFQLVIVGMIAVGCILLAAVLWTTIVTTPLKTLADVATRVTGGDMSARMPLTKNQDEIGKLARAFNEMLSALNAAHQQISSQDQRKSAFVADVSHEFKSPLGIMNLSLSTLAMGQLGPLSDAQKRMIEICQRNVNRLTQLVMDILDVSRIEAGKIELKLCPLDLTQLVQEELENFRATIDQKKLLLELVQPEDVQTHLIADGERLRQVITNLLSNAVKYTPDGGRMVITFSNPDPAHLSWEIANSGPNITPENLARLFSKFERIKAEKTEGTGLGLCIARDLVELHHGKIQVTSRPGDLTRFEVILPLQS